MGRPYKSELNAVPQTLDWAAKADIVGVTRIVRAIVTRPLIVRFLAPLGMTWQGNASSFGETNCTVALL